MSLSKKNKFQKFRVAEFQNKRRHQGTEAQSKKVRKVSEFQSFKVNEDTKALSIK